MKAAFLLIAAALVISALPGCSSKDSEPTVIKADKGRPLPPGKGQAKPNVP